MLLSLGFNVLCSLLAQEGSKPLLSVPMYQALDRAKFSQA